MGTIKPLKVWYFVREWSEYEAFPDVHIYLKETEARDAMKADVIEVQRDRGGWITEDLDGPAITRVLCSGLFFNTITSLNVQQEDGRADCWRLESQVVK